MREITQQGSPPVFFKAVVVDVFYDPSSMTTEEKTALRDRVGNPELVEYIPVNAILGRIVNDNHDRSDQTPYIFFPFFSSHFMLPVSPGEQVSIVYDDYQNQSATLGRWVTRIHENYAVEDANYTHGDRKYDPALAIENVRTSQQQQNSGNNSKATFPNGGGTPQTYTLFQEGGTNSYEQIVNNAKAKALITSEVVPRWNKRPQELVIQGSNNTLISLGEDRTGPVLRISGSNQVDRTGQAGTIDFVAGRGRFPLSATDSSATEKSATSPIVTENTRNKLETDKTPNKRQKRKNPKEGDPDFKRDAARLYMSQQTLGDKNFKTKQSTNASEGIDYPSNTLKPAQPNESSNAAYGKSYVIGKADHIRFIARKETDPVINGTLLLIKEGLKDQDLAYLYFDETGKAQYYAKELHFGKSTEKTEPYIKYTKFKETVEGLQNQINTLENTIKQIATQIQTLAATSVCVPFTTDPAVISIGQSVGSIGQALDLTQTRNTTSSAKDNAKSIRIFGE